MDHVCLSGMRWGRVRRSPLWAPHSWTRAPPVPPPSRASASARGRRHGSTNVEPAVDSFGSPPSHSSQAYMAVIIYFIFISSRFVWPLFFQLCVEFHSFMVSLQKWQQRFFSISLFSRPYISFLKIPVVVFLLTSPIAEWKCRFSHFRTHRGRRRSTLLRFQCLWGEYIRSRTHWRGAPCLHSEPEWRPFRCSKKEAVCVRLLRPSSGEGRT